MTTVSVGVSAVGLLPFGATLGARAFSQAAADAVLQVLEALRSPLMLIGLVLLMALGAAAWAFVAERMLSRRVRWAVLPAQDFDPTEEDVARFGSALGRCIKRGPMGRLGRSGCAVRVRLASAGSGRMSYELEVPQHAVSVVRSAVYSGVVLDDPDEIDLAVVRGLPASPEEGAATAATTSSEGVEWARRAGGGAGEDWIHDSDRGEPGSRE